MITKYFHKITFGVILVFVLLSPQLASAAPYVYRTNTAPSYYNKGTGWTGSPVSKTMTISNGYVNLEHYVECSHGWFSSCSSSKYVMGFFVQRIYASQWDTYRLDLSTSGTFTLSGEATYDMGDPDGDYIIEVDIVVRKSGTTYLSEEIDRKSGTLSTHKSIAVPIDYSKSMTFGFTTGTFEVFYYFKLTVSVSDADLLPADINAEAQFTGYLGSSVLKLYKCYCGE